MDIRILFYTRRVLTALSATLGISNENIIALEVLNRKGDTRERKNDYA
ncbi:MAG: hypothetical protein KAQ68_07260 [Clostridiales bacterium]|nr:hypothetical protein [Clostridiales bacterium]